MTSQKKHCDTCDYAYYKTRQKRPAAGDCAKMQYCSSEKYASADYTPKMLLEDWDKGHCRFWAPKRLEKDGIS